MKYSTVENEYLIELLNAAVKNTAVKAPPKNINWKAFVDLAKRQQVYSIIAPVLSSISMPEEQSKELVLYNQNELLRLIAMKNEQEQLESELEKAGIKFMLLKGSLLRNYYPQLKMRQMSDVDILYDYSKRDKLFEIMKGRGYTLISDGGNSDDFTKKPFYTFEFHHRLFKDAYGFCPDFDFVWDNAVQASDNSCKYNMSVEDLYLHSAAHMYKHYIFGGFGIRFFIDTYLLVMAEEKSWNQEYIDKKLREMKIFDFERLVKKISFNLMNDEELDTEQTEFFNKVTGSGIYGSHQYDVSEVYENIKRSTGKSSVLSYIFIRLFPSKKQMKSIYPQLESKPFLMPFYYVKRIIVKAFGNFGKIINEIKSLMNIKKNNGG